MERGKPQTRHGCGRATRPAPAWPHYLLSVVVWNGKRQLFFFYWGEEVNVVKWVQVPGKAIADGEHSGWCCSTWALLPHIEPCLWASRTPACETSPQRKTCCRDQLTSIFICPCRFNPSLPNGCLARHMGMWPNTEQTPSQPALGCAPHQTSTTFFQGHTHTRVLLPKQKCFQEMGGQGKQQRGQQHHGPASHVFNGVPRSLA